MASRRSYAPAMDSMPLEENRASLDRLTAWAADLPDVDLPDPEAAARALAQLAFWDSWALQVLIRWRSGVMPPPALPDWYDDAVNAALTDTWVALPVAAALNVAIRAAKAVNTQIAHLESPVLAALVHAGQLHLVERYRDRLTVLDLLDQQRSTA
jgi:hypothetical protein